MRSGFSLIEVMIVASMMSGAAVLMANMAKQTAVQNATQLTRTNLDNEITAWRSVLGDNTTCVNAFSAVTMIGGVGYTYTSGQSVTAGGLTLRVGSSLGTSNTQITGLQLLGVGQIYPLPSVTTITASGSTQYALPGTSTTVTVRTLATALRIFTGPPPSVTTVPNGSMNMQRDIGMTVSYDTSGGRIRACTTSIDQLIMCRDLGGNLNTNGLCTQWTSTVSMNSMAIGSTAVPGGASAGAYFDPSGNATIGGTLSAGATNLSSLTATDTNLASTLTVTGTANLSSLTAAVTNLASTLTVTGTASLNTLTAVGTNLGSTLTVMGTANINSLSASGLATLEGLNVVGGATVGKVTVGTSLNMSVTTSAPSISCTTALKGQMTYVSNVGLYVCNGTSWESFR